MKKSTMQNGFTMVEVMMIMVVVAFIISGVMVGQSMIRGAQFRSVMGDVTKYTLAMNNFRDKYQALPGDMPTAQSYWGGDPGGCPNPNTGTPLTSYTAVPHRETCNGNGDGKLANGNFTSGFNLYEMFRVWQQLADSSMIDGDANGEYNGISGTTNQYNAIIGVNVPSTSISGTGFMVSYMTTDAAWLLNDINRHAFWLGTPYSNGYTIGPFLTPAEALAMDSKLDDGIPVSGNFRAMHWNVTPNCITPNSTTAGLYNTSYTSYACSFVVLTDF